MDLITLVELIPPYEKKKKKEKRKFKENSKKIQRN